MVTLPNPTEMGEAESWRMGATPLPDSEAITDGFGELFASVSVPENEVAEVGRKLTVKGTLAPGAIVRGDTSPE